MTTSSWPGGEQLQAVDLRAAHLDRDIQAVLLVDAFRHGLVEAAVLGLREPVGREDDAFRGLGADGYGKQQRSDKQQARGDPGHRGAPGDDTRCGTAASVIMRNFA